MEATLQGVLDTLRSILADMDGGADTTSLAKEATLREGVNALEGMIDPAAGAPASPALRVNVVETVGGGGGGGDATAANQVIGNTTLSDILNKLIADPSTEAKQDDAIALLTAIDAALAGTLAVSAASLPLPAGAATEATVASILAAMGTPALPSGAATEATLLLVLSALAAPIAVNAASLPLPAGAATEAKQDAAIALLPTTLDAGNFRVAVETAIPSGPNTIGVVGIDQATPGTTNGVVINSVPAITKGTQGSTGFTVQPLHDAGRTSVCFYTSTSSINAVGGYTSGTVYLHSMVQADGSATVSGAATSFVIPSGKIFRIQNIYLYTRENATANVYAAMFRLRLDTSGTVATTSPIIMEWVLGREALASAPLFITESYPEGFDIVGNGTTAFGLTVETSFTANSPVTRVKITGYFF